jgi:hypothetical protein
MVTPLTPRPDKLDVVNVRTLDSSGSTTILTNLDNRTQIFNLGAAKAVQLPYLNINAGEKWIVKKQDASYKLTIQCVSAAASTSIYIPSSQVICYLDSRFAYAEFTALVNNPSTPDQWDMNFKYQEKQYLADIASGTNDIAYNGGIKATITGNPTWTGMRRAVLTPVQLFDGTWRIKGNIHAHNGTLDSNTKYLIVNGISFKASVNTYQSFVSHQWSTSSGTSYGQPSGPGFVDYSDSNKFWFNPAGNTFNDAELSFDLELNVRPTWAF